MSTPVYSDPARIILHPTDFSPQAERAFAHALRLALQNKGYLTLLHAKGPNEAVRWDEFPSVRATLERWGLLEKGSHRSDVGKLGVQIEKIVGSAPDVVKSIEGVLQKRPVQLLVMASEGREGLSRWLTPSVAERAVRTTHIPALFVPEQGRCCVSPEDGSVTMERVLIPVSHELPVGPAIERAIRAMDAFGSESAQLTLLHVGEASDFPDVPDIDSAWSVVRTTRQGDPAEEIAAAATESDANLIVLVSDGVQGVSDKLMGTTSEQIVRKAPCPVMVLPADY